MIKAHGSTTDQEALLFHSQGRPGKIEIRATKPLTTQRDLSLAYSPGVAVPCLRIAEDPSLAYDYTAKGNMVAVISNGTAVLGLGDLGAIASKPVMEGKAVLFKRFADIDSIDLEIDTRDVDEFINCVRYLGPSFGGINLEDIKAPECFIIEQRLRELLDIPVFHDDQHGTAIIATAGLINALHLTGRNFADIKMVVNGAGAASIACVELIKTMGLPHDNCILVRYQGRHLPGPHRRHEPVEIGPCRADQGAQPGRGPEGRRCLLRPLGQRGGDAGDGGIHGGEADHLRHGQSRSGDHPGGGPCACARTPSSPPAARTIPNQVNNVLGFPYIFRGALDVRASTINDQMKIAAAHALAELAREDVPDEVDAAYAGRRLRFGPDYIIPVPFDPRLISSIPIAVAKAAMESGVARKPILDLEGYRAELSGRLDPTAASLNLIFERVRNNPRRVVFAEGEEEKVIRAAVAFHHAGYGTPVLVGREERIHATMQAAGLGAPEGIEITNARLSDRNKDYTELLYRRLQRKGALYRDCLRMANQDRNVFAACMVAEGDADAMVTGVTRSFSTTLEEILRVLDPRPGHILFGLSVVIAHGRTVLLADTAVHELPSAQELADIATQAAEMARLLGHEPRVALLSFSNFGNPPLERMERVRDAVRELDSRQVDFEYDGEMQANVALDFELMRQLYPFCRLTGAANVLLMPALHSAAISAKLLQQLGGGTVYGPILCGLAHAAQIVQTGATVSEIVTAAALASLGANAELLTR